MRYSLILKFKKAIEFISRLEFMNGPQMERKIISVIWKEII